MKTKYCYLYDNNTREYIGTGIAYESPLEKDVFIAPPNSTYTKPPEALPNKVSCFIDNEWQYFDDFRGDYYIINETSEIGIIQNIGVLTNDCSLIPAELLKDYYQNPQKYKFINNVLTDISNTDEYKTLSDNIGKHLLNINDGSILTINKIMQIPEGYILLDDELYENYMAEQDKYKIIDNKLIDISDTDEYKNLQKEKILKLHLTAADVERALYKARQIDFEDILQMVSNVPNIDIKELKIEFKAKDFYRGNPYIDKIGKLLGITSEQLDEFFKTNNYEYLRG